MNIGILLLIISFSLSEIIKHQCIYIYQIFINSEKITLFNFVKLVRKHCQYTHNGLFCQFSLL